MLFGGIAVEWGGCGGLLSRGGDEERNEFDLTMLGVEGLPPPVPAPFWNWKKKRRQPPRLNLKQFCLPGRGTPADVVEGAGAAAVAVGAAGAEGEGNHVMCLHNYSCKFQSFCLAITNVLPAAFAADVAGGEDGAGAHCCRPSRPS